MGGLYMKGEDFKNYCEKLGARVWASHLEENKDIVRVDIESYNKSVKIRDFAEKLGFENDSYLEHQDYIGMSFHLGEFKEEIFPVDEIVIF